ncbi:hypothetical protein LTR49_028836, partial [Elasticomyces elasticus]
QANWRIGQDFPDEGRAHRIHCTRRSLLSKGRRVRRRFVEILPERDPQRLLLLSRQECRDTEQSPTWERTGV